MALSSTITTADEAGSSKAFVEIERSGTRVVRLGAGSTLALPMQLVIVHSSSTDKKTGVTTYRHLVQGTKSVLDANGVKVTTIVNLTINVPEGAAAGDAEEVLGYIQNFLNATTTTQAQANVDNLLIGES
jgi:hypothetical protein